MPNLAELLQRHCRHREGEPLPEAQIAEQLRLLPHWRHEAGALVREYRFGNYYETLAFVNALAFVVHREDHHPDLVVSYARCEVRFNTHSVGGVSENDFICAAKADALFAQRYSATCA